MALPPAALNEVNLSRGAAVRGDDFERDDRSGRRKKMGKTRAIAGTFAIGLTYIGIQLMLMAHTASLL